MISWTSAISAIFGQIYNSCFFAEEGLPGQDFYFFHYSNVSEKISVKKQLNVTLKRWIEYM